MELIINYSGVRKSDALEKHIESKVNKLAHKTNLDRSEIGVWLHKESSLMSSGLPEFSTCIRVKKPGLSQWVAEARSSHLADSVNQAAERVSRQILKEKKGGFHDQKVQRSLKRNTQ